MFFSKYCKDMQTTFLGTLGTPGYVHPKWYDQLVENFGAYRPAKNDLNHSLLSWDITFKRIMQFDWPTTFWPITWEQEFCQIRPGGEISITILVFTLDYFQEKLTRKVFKKSKKKTFGGNFRPSLLKFGQKRIFMEKRALPVFKCSNYLTSCKNQKKLMTHSWEKEITDGWTNRQTGRGSNKQTNRTEFQ